MQVNSDSYSQPSAAQIVSPVMVLSKQDLNFKSILLLLLLLLIYLQYKLLKVQPNEEVFPRRANPASHT